MMGWVEHWEEISLSIVSFFFPIFLFQLRKGEHWQQEVWSGRGFQQITTPPSFLHHSALHTTLFVHTSDGTNTNDSEPHQALLNKLHRMQVPSPLIHWFEGYLSQRLQRVTLKLMVSVPPGSQFFLGCHRVQFVTLVVSNLYTLMI